MMTFFIGEVGIEAGKACLGLTRLFPQSLLDQQGWWFWVKILAQTKSEVLLEDPKDLGWVRGDWAGDWWERVRGVVKWGAFSRMLLRGRGCALACAGVRA